MSKSQERKELAIMLKNYFHACFQNVSAANLRQAVTAIRVKNAAIAVLDGIKPVEVAHVEAN